MPAKLVFFRKRRMLIIIRRKNNNSIAVMVATFEFCARCELTDQRVSGVSGVSGGSTGSAVSNPQFSNTLSMIKFSCPTLLL